MPNYEWDIQKAADNVVKHSVTFDEAATTFDDPLAAFFDDVLHSENKDRYLLVGFSSQNRLLFVSHTAGTNGTIRIVSARLATERERENMNEKMLDNDDLLPEYDLDYCRAKPNPYVKHREAVSASPLTVKIDADVAAVFTSADTVNAVPRALIQTMPPTAATR